jgi:hypothetical protein
MNKYIVVVGKLFGPITFHGPFATQEHAERWAATYADTQPYTIQPLQCFGVQAAYAGYAYDGNGFYSKA